MAGARLTLMILAAVGSAQADFSYTMTQKSAQAAGNDQVVKHYLKGQKMKQDRGSRTVILDFGAQTTTTLDNTAKTYTVSKFSDLPSAPAGPDISVDVKATGQKKNINGFEASQVILTMDVDMPQARQAGIKPTLEMELWLSKDVPGGQELASFYKKNAANFPTAALGSSNPSLQKAMAKLQQQFGQFDGVPVMEIIHVKMGGGGPSTQQMQQMAQARAQLEALAAQGGAQAAAAQAALARMGAAGGGSLFEVTMTGSDFSTAPIPESVFAIPEGYKAAEK